jgi:hypothetical protein
VGLSEERSASDQDQPYPGAARTLTGVASPCSPLISELLATFLGPALGLAEDRHRQRGDRQRASRHLKEGGSALAAIVEERLVARLKAGPRGRYDLLDCLGDAEEIAALEIRIRD